MLGPGRCSHSPRNSRPDLMLRMGGPEQPDVRLDLEPGIVVVFKL